MSAHRGELKCVPIGHAVGLAEKPERILDAMPLEARLARTFLSFVERGADVDGKAEIGLLQFLDEGNDSIVVVENRGNGGRTGNAFYNVVDVGGRITMPVHRGSQIPRWVEHPAMARIAQIHRIVF